MTCLGRRSRFPARSRRNAAAFLPGPRLAPRLTRRLLVLLVAQRARNWVLRRWPPLTGLDETLPI